jgi:3-phosphoshikimate 1-carboxyvinyltransferase
MISRDHTERMLEALGMRVRTAGPIVSLQPPSSASSIKPFTIELPGDLSAAAFLLTAAAIVPDSQVTTRQTGLNPTRTGIIDVIRMLGGRITTTPHGEVLNEPFGEVTVSASSLRSGVIGGELSVRSIDEIPIACALAARASGVTEFCDVGELRVKESDRIALMVGLLRAFGVDAIERADGFTVEGKPRGRLKAARIDSGGDHRIAMTAAVLGLLADEETIIDDVACIATSFPRFVGTLRALGAEIEVRA